ncbi:two-component sensor histidine kinase [Rubrivivax gelatinosus]|nr:HAMP domain-containing sensor histidine kinase [Rubrivivax gelatinosus]MBK1686651.1 two-component sensor histidine kinase [Rubrivivax gelatinosus]
MGLADFIIHDLDAIMAEWEAFAATQLPAAEGMSSLALRDHAPAILLTVARDLKTQQTQLQQADKSKGLAPVSPGAPQTAAQTHAVLRARHGFDINQLVAEYRALRASVLRRWLAVVPLERPQVEEVMRFNEAIDQAVAESVAHFHAQVEFSRNLVLAMLGHDMRTPLGNIFMTATYLHRLQAGEQVTTAAARLMRSGESLRALIDDLTTFGRTSLGLGLSLACAPIDLAPRAADEVEQLRGAHPGRHIELSISGDTHGHWDGVRLQQLLRNLVSNAIRYGSRDAPVQVVLDGRDPQLVLRVDNRGEPADAQALARLFGPLERGSAPQEGGEGRESLGLGLYIVREIAQAHGGEVTVRCDGDLTAFTVRLPRGEPGTPAAADTAG